METTRQNKISRLLQKELSEIFLLQTKAMHGTLVSVSAVRISPDMSIARVYPVSYTHLTLPTTDVV